MITHHKHKNIENCNHIADEIDNDQDEIGNDNQNVEMKTKTCTHRNDDKHINNNEFRTMHAQI